MRMEGIEGMKMGMGIGMGTTHIRLNGIMGLMGMGIEGMRMEELREWKWAWKLEWDWKWDWEWEWIE